MSGDLRIREYLDGDLDAVLHCFHRSVRGIASRHYDAAQLSAWAPDVPDRKLWQERLRTGRTLLAEYSGELAGFVRVEDSGYIDLLYVDPAYERRGLGRRLLSEACEWVKSRGAVRLTSEVSLAARPAFEALGFQVDAEQTVERRGVRFTNFRMSRAA